MEHGRGIDDRRTVVSVGGLLAGDGGLLTYHISILPYVCDTFELVACNIYYEFRTNLVVCDF
jgi:hypothetical protein